MPKLNETHDAASAQLAAIRQPIPIPIFRSKIFRSASFAGRAATPQGGVAIGDCVFDLKAALAAGLFSGPAAEAAGAAAGPQAQSADGARQRCMRRRCARGCRICCAIDSPERAKVEAMADRLLVPMAEMTTRNAGRRRVFHRLLHLDLPCRAGRAGPQSRPVRSRRTSNISRSATTAAPPRSG